MAEPLSVLLVSHNFPPTAGPESALVRLNAEWMIRAGFDLQVLTTTQAHTIQAMDASLMAGLPSGLIVERQASPEAVLSEKSPKLGRWAAVTLGRNVLPEVFLPWAIPATKRGMAMMAARKTDVIYSRAPKHVSNVVGWRLKQKTGLPWVAHFSDPWITGGLRYRRLQRWLGLPLERRILRDADAVVFVTRQALERILKPYPDTWRSRAVVIPHGYEKPAEIVPPVSIPGTGPLRLIHAGAFYPGLRSPETLIEALRLMQAAETLAGRLVITCIGEDSAGFGPRAAAAGLSEVLQFLPPVSFAECQRRIASSEMMLIIDTPGYGGMFLPTKLFEAFALERSVLALTEPGSGLADILEKTGYPWADVQDPVRIATVLSQLLSDWEGRRWHNVLGRAEVRDSYQVDRVNVPLAELFRRLAGKQA